MCVCVNDVLQYNNGCGPFNYHDVFDVAEEVAKVDMEKVAMCSDHDVVIMTITNTLCQHN